MVKGVVRQSRIGGGIASVLPAILEGSGGVTVTRVGNVTTIGFDSSQLATDINNLPTATLPLTGTEPFSIVQGGELRYAPVSAGYPPNFLTPQQFGGVSDGVEDITSQVQDAIDELQEGVGGEYGGVVLLPTGVYRITDTLEISQSNIRLLGMGGTGLNFDNSATYLYWDGITDANTPLLRIAPVDDPASIPLSGCDLRNIFIDGQSKIGRGIAAFAVTNSTFENVFATNCTADHWHLTSAASGDLARGGGNVCLRWVNCVVACGSTSNGWFLSGATDPNSNTNFCQFHNCDAYTTDGTGFLFDNADSNRLETCRAFVSGTGKGIDIRGFDGSNGFNDSNCFDNCYWDSFHIRGTDEGFTIPAKGICILGWNKANDPPLPVCGADATFFGDTPWRTYTPEIVSDSGTFTSVSATGRFKKINFNTVDVDIEITITTNGTAGTIIYATLPENMAQNCTLAGKDNTNGVTLSVGGVTGLPDNLYIIKYDATYPGADGHVLHISGRYETAD